MNVGEAALESGMSVKTLHYYEEIGLVVPARRSNGYRAYDNTHLHKLRFLNRARSLGFTVGDCRNLLSLYEDQNRASADVKRLAIEHIEEIDRKIEDLKDMRDILSHLADACHGDDRPDCPILDGLAGTENA